jgi:hypothetical protein
LYDDVETLIDFGFLSQNLVINDVVVSLRSLNPGDQFLLRHRVHNAGHDEWRVQAIAASIWMVAGHNLLGESAAIPMMVKILRNMPPNGRDILFNVVLGLFDRTGKAVEAVESYAYEKMSRYKWRTMGGQSFGEYSGVPSLGTNNVQRMWTFFNTIEDQRIADDVLWDGFKLTASATSPKGVKKIDAHDRQQRQRELDHRQSIQDQFFYTVKGVVKPVKEGERNLDGPHMGPKTADDLVDEMQRWVSGDDDWHDAIVREYKQRVSENFERHKAESAARAAALAAAREEVSDVPQPLVGYTPEQLAVILGERNPGPPGVRQVGGNEGQVREYLYTKYIDRPADPGALKVEDGRMKVMGQVGKERPDLDQQIANRQVVYRSEPDGDQEEPLPPEW